jgi:hypothetical protein
MNGCPNIVLKTFLQIPNFQHFPFYFPSNQIISIHNVQIINKQLKQRINSNLHHLEEYGYIKKIKLLGCFNPVGR